MQVSATLVRPPVYAARVAGVAPLNVTAAIAAYKNDPKAKFEISDTAANIASNFDALSRISDGLTKVTVTVPSASIALNASQYLGGAKVFAAIKSDYKLKVTDVTMDQLNGIAANAKVFNVEVKDSSANIGTKFSNLLNQPGKIDKITQMGAASDIAMSGDIFSRSTAQTLLGKIQESYTLALSDVTIDNLSAAASNSHVNSVAVKDTSAHISTNLSGANPSLAGAKVSSISQSDALGSISITDTKFQALTSTLNKLAGTSRLAVTGVTASRAAGVASNASVKSVSVTDTAANIYSNRAANNAATKISAVTISDTGVGLSASLTNILGDSATTNSITKIKLTNADNIVMTGAQLKDAAVTALLGKVYGSNDAKGNYHLTATSVLVADVSAAAKMSTVNKIQVNDSVSNALASLTALNISAVDKIDLTGGNGALVGGLNLDKLDALGTKLNSISSNSDNIAISYDQYTKRSATLAKINYTGKLVVSDAGASAAKQLKDDTGVATFTVKDSAAKLVEKFTDLSDAVAAAKLTQLKLTDNGSINLTATQYTGANSLLNKVKDANGGTDFKLQLSGATAGTLVALYTNSNHYSNVTKVSISDTSANISAKLTDLGAAFSASKLGDIRLTGTAADISITKTQLDNANIAGALGKISGIDGTLGNYTLDVTGVSADGASGLIGSNSKVAKVSVSDTSANITTNLASIVGISASKLKAVEATDYANNEITIASSDLASASYTAVLGKMGGNYKLNVTDVSAASAKTLTDANSKVSHLTVKDTGASISGKLTDLNALKDSGKLTNISFAVPENNTLILTTGQYNDNSVSALTILNGGDYKLSISGVTVDDATNDAKNVNIDTHVTSYSVKDVGANIQAKLLELDSRGDKIGSINWTDTVDGNGADQALSITGLQYHNYIGTLSKINGGEYNAHITELSAADTAAAENDANISEFSVKDTAANLGANLTALQASAAAGTVKIQAIEQNGAGDVAMSATAYTASTEARALMTTSSITMTVSDVAAADVGTVIGDAQVTSISVSDTASNLVAKLGDLVTPGDLDTNVAKITAVTVNDNNVLDLTGAQYADNVAAGGILDMLSQNTGGYHATITELAGSNVAAATADTNVDSFTAKDTAAALTTNFADLVAANVSGKLTSINNSDTGSVSIPLADLVAHAQDYANTLNKFDAPPAVTLT